MFKAISGPILANTVRVNGVVAAEDVACSLPEVTPVTSEYSAMGTIEMPVTGQYDNMEFSITKTGIDGDLGLLTSPTKKTIEIRAAVDVLNVDGTKKVQGIKAFITAFPKSFPGIEIEKGTASENEITYTATRYQLFANGVEVILVDKLAGIVRFNGKDYSQEIRSLL